ncbi:unnamed protein product [Urochloa humidicola]
MEIVAVSAWFLSSLRLASAREEGRKGVPDVPRWRQLGQAAAVARRGGGTMSEGRKRSNMDPLSSPSVPRGQITDFGWKAWAILPILALWSYLKKNVEWTKM